MITDAYMIITECDWCVYDCCSSRCISTVLCSCPNIPGAAK